jgi:hypothetical protein
MFPNVSTCKFLCTPTITLTVKKSKMQFSTSAIINILLLVFVGQVSSKKIKLFGRQYQQKIVTLPNTAHVIQHTSTLSGPAGRETAGPHMPQEMRRSDKPQTKSSVVEIKHRQGKARAKR